MKILIICTGNTCRSQMAEGFLRSFDPKLEVFSAGTRAEQKVNPFAVKAMAETGIDISKQYPKQVDIFLNENFDYVITVCNGAKEVCPLFTGRVHHRMHMGFEDPANAKGTEKAIMEVYRKVRDQMKEQFYTFYQSIK
ncbi:MAG TPA: arsenate reductase ArsC [Bacteroidales bacterium]|nr:arsenate reductase ArsC [Bacteroidales bacterium]